MDLGLDTRIRLVVGIKTTRLTSRERYICYFEKKSLYAFKKFIIFIQTEPLNLTF